ncbi:MAG: peptidoglycan synthetase [Bacteroidetes bacterium MED-G13]|nr:MAG: peptidoglycan synthetase [Bacteroidetes bacterium MED-G13]
MKIHFIAIGGSAMHNLAIALKLKGFLISGSDDIIREPSKSRLAKYSLLPESEGWFPEKIKKDLDAIVLGMHAKKDNPELLEAKKNGLKIYSYPEFIFEMSKDKLRVVIGGSHGKTSITSMILHVLNIQNIETDFMVGAQLSGFDVMVKLSKKSKFIVLEGDEYLSSVIDPRPKFHLYKPNFAVLSGIAWDHINVFKTFEDYYNQFKIFIETIEDNGILVYNSNDIHVSNIIKSIKKKIKMIPYSIIKNEIINGITNIRFERDLFPIQLFGKHNLENISAACQICTLMGVEKIDFFNAIKTFKGADNRLELIYKSNSSFVYKDFAHSPSKVKATVNAVKLQYPNKKLIVAFELHTYSSLNPVFIKKYRNTLKNADDCVISFSEKNMKIKRFKPIAHELIINAFNHQKINIATDLISFEQILLSFDLSNSVLLLMSSGNFNGFDYKKIKKILK